VRGSLPQGLLHRGPRRSKQRWRIWEYAIHLLRLYNRNSIRRGIQPHRTADRSRRPRRCQPRLLRAQRNAVHFLIFLNIRIVYGWFVTSIEHAGESTAKTLKAFADFTKRSVIFGFQGLWCQ
jgi:hypothetical protein